MNTLETEPNWNGQNPACFRTQTHQPNRPTPRTDQAGCGQTTRFRSWGAVLASVLLAGLGAARVAADVPMILHYQGNVEMSGSNYHGTGYFKFALVDASGATSYWSNDDSSSAGSEPSAAVPIPVDNGYYSVLLGNTSVPGMTMSIPHVVFRQNERVWLRIWFSHSTANFEHLEPDQRIAAVGYAMVAQTVVEGGITASAIADGAVTTDKLAPNAITSAVIPDHLELGDADEGGSLKVWPPSPAPGVQSLNETIRLRGEGGEILTQGDIASLGSFKALMGGLPFIPFGITRTVVHMRAEEHGGVVTTSDEEGVTSGVFGSQTGAGGRLILNQNSGRVGVELTGDEGGLDNGAQLTLYQHTTDRKGVELDADAGGANGGGHVKVCQSSGANGVVLTGDESGSDGGAQLTLYQHSGDSGIVLDGDAGGANGGGVVRLLKGDGTTASIVLRAEASSGEGRITTQVLEITGGSDLSEHFQVRSGGAAVEPGMIVCIDAERPGELRVSDRPYDVTVAGVVSGAGGVKPGMLMSQHGSVADGKHPVALTGRVYCRMDASYGAIKPGDLITTSDTPGHGMKADPAKAAGAIIGKAMTPLAEGRGLVLVLVSLQ